MVIDWLRGLHDLVFPNVCLSCSAPLTGSGQLLCPVCETELVASDSPEQPANELTDRLAGRLPVTYAAAAYVFTEGNVCQRLIHRLKYHHRADVGRGLGERLGRRLATKTVLADLHGIVPVPIHPRRRHERGYNQAEVIGEGLSTALGIPVYAEALRRRSFRGSQTKRGKLDRLANVRDSFATGSGAFAGRHLLLVDDVMTTGATLDFCGNLLLAAHPGLRLSVATLAITEKAY